MSGICNSDPVSTISLFTAKKYQGKFSAKPWISCSFGWYEKLHEPPERRPFSYSSMSQRLIARSVETHMNRVFTPKQ